MGDLRRLLPVLAVAVVAVLLGLRAVAEQGAGVLAAGAVTRDARGDRVLSEADRAGGLTFAADVPPADRADVLAVVASARPEARRLVDLVDGLVDVEVGRPEAGAAGQTTLGGRRYPVVLDVEGVRARYGRRGVARLTLHELGHVIDDALVPDDVMARLDAATPRGYGCEGAVAGGCASVQERFAESFAKWALGDIGMNIDLGYEVPPPSLSTWGRPLEAVGR